MKTLQQEIIRILESGDITGADAEAASIVRAAQTTTPADHADTARAMAQRRATGEPLAYLLGEKEFSGLMLDIF